MCGASPKYHPQRATSLSPLLRKESAAVPVFPLPFSLHNLFLHASFRSRVQRLSLRPILPKGWTTWSRKSDTGRVSGFRPTSNHRLISIRLSLGSSYNYIHPKSSRRKSARVISCERMRLQCSVREQMIDSKHYPSVTSIPLHIPSTIVDVERLAACRRMSECKEYQKVKELSAKASP